MRRLVWFKAIDLQTSCWYNSSFQRYKLNTIRCVVFVVLVSWGTTAHFVEVLIDLVIKLLGWLLRSGLFQQHEQVIERLTINFFELLACVRSCVLRRQRRRQRQRYRLGRLMLRNFNNQDNHLSCISIIKVRFPNRGSTKCGELIRETRAAGNKKSMWIRSRRLKKLT